MSATLQTAEDQLDKWAHCGAQAPRGSLLAPCFFESMFLLASATFFVGLGWRGRLVQAVVG